MRTKKLLFVTGITGFMGSSLFNNYKLLEKFQIVGSSSSSHYKFINDKLNVITSEELETILKKSSEINILHLATFFSLDKNDEEKVIDANIKFGNNLLKKITDLKVKKIIYINTMYTFSEDSKVLGSTYVKSKNIFSKTLENFCREKNINIDELYIGNTFGKNDNRKKIIPLIIDSLKNGNENPINNPDIYLNFLNIDLIIDFIKVQLSEDSSNKYVIYSNFDYNLSSIYLFLQSILNTQDYQNIKTKKSELKKVIPTNLKRIGIDFDIHKSLKTLVE